MRRESDILLKLALWLMGLAAVGLVLQVWLVLQ